MRNAFVAFVLLALCCVDRGNAKLEVPKICTGCNFAGQSLQNTDFSSGTYVGTNFAKSDLRGSSFRQARLVAANFQDADLRNAALDGLDCTACNFQGAKFDGASFEGVRMVAANFDGFNASVPDTELRALMTQCVSCNFANSSLQGRDLSDLTLISVDFSGADLRNARFDGSVLCWSSINGSKRETLCDKLAGAKLDGTSFQNINLCDDPAQRLHCTVVGTRALRNLTGGAIDGIAPANTPAPSPAPTRESGAALHTSLPPMIPRKPPTLMMIKDTYSFGVTTKSEILPVS